MGKPRRNFNINNNKKKNDIQEKKKYGKCKNIIYRW
jgi:hypothetical protein